jgi:glycosyltransferase involved in cell wall biosynthesis
MMKVSVIIPAYNCETTIEDTIESVLEQTVLPDEILILDDGSTDNTASLLDSYKYRIKVWHMKNRGVANARNFLCGRARGDLIAFLDSDDIWHPAYLQTQWDLFERHPTAIGFFTGHFDFDDGETYRWPDNPFETLPNVELIPGLDFFRRYIEQPGPFNMSFCCIPRRTLKAIGTQPFGPGFRRAEDFYFFCLLAISNFGSVVYTPAPLAGYRNRKNSLSKDRVKLLGSVVQALELLKNHCETTDTPELTRALETAFASKRRCYAKALMHTNNKSEARKEALASLGSAENLMSMGKSIALLLLSYLPISLQPKSI